MELTIEQVRAYKNEIEAKKLGFIHFDNSDIDIFYKDYLPTGFYLEIGDEVHDPSSILTDEEILEWSKESEAQEDVEDEAEEMGESDADDVEVDIENLRSQYDEAMSEYSPLWTYPSGRAFQFFDELIIDRNVLGLLNISLIDGEHPGSDWCGVLVLDYPSLVLLQWVLDKEGTKANFFESK